LSEPFMASMVASSESKFSSRQSCEQDNEVAHTGCYHSKSHSRL